MRLKAYKQAGWSYDAKKLEENFISQAAELEDKGENEKGEKDLEAAGAANRIAIELGRSRAEIYLSEANRTEILVRDTDKGRPIKLLSIKDCILLIKQSPLIPMPPEGYARKLKIYTMQETIWCTTPVKIRARWWACDSNGWAIAEIKSTKSYCFVWIRNCIQINWEYELDMDWSPAFVEQIDRTSWKIASG